MLKNLVKNISNPILKVLKQTITQNRKKDEFLFKNISDREINEMFSSIGI